MAKWLIPIVVLVGLVVLLLRPSGSPEPVVKADVKATHSPIKHQTSATPQSRPEVRVQPSIADPNQAALYTGVTPAVPETDGGVISNKSEEFGRVVDVVVAATFREEMAKCDIEGLDPNLKLTINYGVRMVNGEVFAENVRLVDSQLKNPSLERCFVDAVKNTRWRDDTLPDFSEDDQDLFLSIRQFKKFKTR